MLAPISKVHLHHEGSAMHCKHDTHIIVHLHKPIHQEPVARVGWRREIVGEDLFGILLDGLLCTVDDARGPLQTTTLWPPPACTEHEHQLFLFNLQRCEPLSITRLVHLVGVPQMRCRFKTD